MHVKTACYCMSLTGDVLKRYQEKTKCLDLCPFEIPFRECSTNPADFPEINLWAIGWYLVTTVSAFTYEQFNNFKSMNSFKMFHCGWVQEAYVKRFGALTTVIGRVNHSQKVGQKPVDTWIISSHSGIIYSAHCTCEAGLGESCSHVSAILFYIEFKVSSLCDTSPTDSKCKWTEPRIVKRVHMDSIQNIDFETPKSKLKKARMKKEPVKCKRRFYDVKKTTPDEKKTLLENLREISSKNALQPISCVIVSDCFSPEALFSPYPTSLRHIFQQKYLNKPLDFLLEKAVDLDIDVTNEQCQRLERETKKQADSKLWYRMRAGRITASTFKSVCHTNLSKPSMSLLKSICYPEKFKFMTTAMKWGNDYEGKAREKYTAITAGNHINFSLQLSGMFIDPALPFMGASPDGLVECACCGKGTLEIKCPYSLRNCSGTQELLENINCCISTLDGDALTLNEKHQYYYQVQLQMLITKRSYCDFFVWTPKQCATIRVHFDQNFCEERVDVCTLYFHLILCPELLGKHWTRNEKNTLEVSNLKSGGFRALLQKLRCNDSPADPVKHASDLKTGIPSASVQNLTAEDNPAADSHELKPGLLRAPLRNLNTNHSVVARVNNASDLKTGILGAPVQNITAGDNPGDSHELKPGLLRVPLRNLNTNHSVVARSNNASDLKTGIPRASVQNITADNHANSHELKPGLLRAPLRNRNTNHSIVARADNASDLKTGIPRASVQNITADNPANSHELKPGLLRVPLRNVNTNHSVVARAKNAVIPVILPPKCLAEANSLMNLDDSKFVVQCFGIQLRGCDFRTLRLERNDLGWLNDNVINAYLKLLTDRSKRKGYPSVFAMDTFFYTYLINRGAKQSEATWIRGENLFQYELIVIPVNLHSHWFVIFVNTSARTITLFDSKHNSYKSCLDNVEDFLKYLQPPVLPDESKETWLKLTPKDIPFQVNNNDCGVFVCLFAEHVSRRAKPCFTEADATKCRKHIALDLAHKRIFYSSLSTAQRNLDKENIVPQSDQFLRTCELQSN